MLEKSEGANENGLEYAMKNKRNRTKNNEKLSNTDPTPKTPVKNPVAADW